MIAAKKRKKELEVTAQKLAGSAHKKVEEAEKKTDAATIKLLLIRVKCLKKSQEIMKTDVPKKKWK